MGRFIRTLAPIAALVIACGDDSPSTTQGTTVNTGAGDQGGGGEQPSGGASASGGMGGDGGASLPPDLELTITDVISAAEGPCIDTIDIGWKPEHSYLEGVSPTAELENFQSGLPAGWMEVFAPGCMPEFCECNYSANGVSCNMSSGVSGMIDAGPEGGLLIVEGSGTGSVSVLVDNTATPYEPFFGPSDVVVSVGPGVHTVRVNNVRALRLFVPNYRELGALTPDRLYQLRGGGEDPTDSFIMVNRPSFIKFEIPDDLTEFRPSLPCRVFDENFARVDDFPPAPGNYYARCYQLGFDPYLLNTAATELTNSCNQLVWLFELRNHGVPVTDLTTADVAVTVDGEDQGVEGGLSLRTNNRPLVTMLLDASFSVSSSGAEAPLRSAAVSFVGSMDEATFFRPYQFASRDQVPTVLYSDSLSPADPRTFGNQFMYPAYTVDALSTYDAFPVATSDAETRLLDSVAIAAAELFLGEGFVDYGNRIKEHVLVTFTDGDDTASSLVEDPSVVRDLVAACRVKPFFVTLGDVVVGDATAIAGANRVVSAATPADLAGAFTQIATDLASAYTLRVVTADVVEVSDTSTLTVTYQGATITKSFSPNQLGACEPPGGFTGIDEGR